MTEKEFIFKPKFQIIGQMPSFSSAIIKEEPMLFSADINFAFKNGGEITRAFIRHYLPTDKDWIIDSRVHMLKPTWYPCIPGWHHDDVPRYTESGQPNYDNPEYKSIHRMCVIGNASLTEFLNKEIFLDRPDPNEVYYKVWNDQINHDILPSDIFKMLSGNVVEFDWQTFHRGTPSVKDDWRFFIRASYNTFRQKYNQIRKQVQVYMPAIEGGW